LLLFPVKATEAIKPILLKLVPSILLSISKPLLFTSDTVVQLSLLELLNLSPLKLVMVTGKVPQAGLLSIVATTAVHVELQPSEITHA
jgi:hypothetical protein